MSLTSRTRSRANGESVKNRDFETAIQPILRGLLAYFVRRAEVTEDAADCLSETLIVLWQKRDQLPQEPGEVRAWSFGIARHVLANHRRSRLRQFALADRLKTELLVDRGALVPSVASETMMALSELKEADQELVTLILWDGFGVAEAGAQLGLKPDAARARYSRARQQLRRRLS